MTDAVLETRGLEKSFGRTPILRGVDLRVPRGELVGFLGQNGAGKTTCIRILARLVRPSGGEARILGRDVRTTPVRRLFAGVGFLVESASPVSYLSGIGNLALHARLSGIRPVRSALESLMDRVGLSGHADRPVREYSLGMRQRLGLAQAMVGDPELLILDEPTNGLDPGGIIEIREALRREVERRGCSVFLSSHLLTEVEVLCTRVAVLDRGRVVGQGRVDELLRSHETVRLRTAAPKRAREALADMDPEGEDGEVRLRGGDDVVARAVRRLVERGIDVYEVTRERRSLEDVYRDLVSRRHAVEDVS